jgi:hypothetical protein
MTKEIGCAECGVSGGYALYCVGCAEKFFGNKEWVGLTGEEIWEAFMESPVELDCSADELYVISRIIEAKLKQKNNTGENN